MADLLALGAILRYASTLDERDLQVRDPLITTPAISEGLYNSPYNIEKMREVIEREVSGGYDIDVLMEWVGQLQGLTLPHIKPLQPPDGKHHKDQYDKFTKYCQRLIKKEECINTSMKFQDSDNYPNGLVDKLTIENIEGVWSFRLRKRLALIYYMGNYTHTDSVPYSSIDGLNVTIVSHYPTIIFLQRSHYIL